MEIHLIVVIIPYGFSETPVTNTQNCILSVNKREPEYGETERTNDGDDEDDDKQIKNTVKSMFDTFKYTRSLTHSLTNVLHK